MAEFPTDIEANTGISSNKTAQFILRGFALQSLQTKFFKVDGDFNDKEQETIRGIAQPESSFGRPVFTSLQFKPFQFQFFNPDTGQNEIIEYDGIRLDTVLMSVTMNKNIVRTAIQGLNGTIKEYASDGDFEIDVKGVIAGIGHDEYPSAEVELLTKIFSVPGAIKLHSEFLSRFGYISPGGIDGITDVVIESFNFPQQEGFRNLQLFQCRMVSDNPIELTI